MAITGRPDYRHFFSWQGTVILPKKNEELTDMISIYKEFYFDSAHFLPNVPDGHPCRALHGHTYHLIVHVKGMISEPEGWLIDYGVLKTTVRSVIGQLDHHLLNEVAGLENPTAEKLVVWLWQRLHPLLPQLSRIELKETPSSGVVYEG